VASPSESTKELRKVKVRAKIGKQGIYQIGDILEVLVIENDRWGRWYLVANSEGQLARLHEKDCEIVEEGK
jgi:hypothetical protein